MRDDKRRVACPRRWLPGLMMAAAAGTLLGCVRPASERAAIHAENAWARPAAMMESNHKGSGTQTGGTAAVYLTLVNDGRENDRLIDVRTDVAERAEIHATTMEGDEMTMHPLQELVVPARGRVELKPGETHVMLVGLRRDLRRGELFQVALRFEKAGTIRVEVEVR